MIIRILYIICLSHIIYDIYYILYIYIYIYLNIYIYIYFTIRFISHVQTIQKNFNQISNFYQKGTFYKNYNRFRLVQNSYNLVGKMNTINSNKKSQNIFNI